LNIKNDLPERAEYENSAGIVDTKYFTFAEPPDDMLLESGQTLGPITLAYETYGKLNDDKSNAILILHAFSGDAHAAGYHWGDNRQGWWDSVIGPGKAFNTKQYFVICSNIIGGCKEAQARHRSVLQQATPMRLLFRSLQLAIWSMPSII